MYILKDSIKSSQFAQQLLMMVKKKKSLRAFYVNPQKYEKLSHAYILNITRTQYIQHI